MLSCNIYAQESPVKVSHIEPLYIDLARDLGARKGEKEINIGAEFASVKNYSKYLLLAEYEWAPINRLGLEVEADIALFNTRSKEAIPKSRIESLKFSAQYTFFVSSTAKLSMAAGYTQLFELPEFVRMSKNNFVSELVYNPFLIVAKRWGSQFHSMLYFSPQIKHELGHQLSYNWQLNGSVHYALPQGKFNIGLELNLAWNKEDVFQISLRPQMKMQVTNNLAIGFVAGIPLIYKSEGFSSFIRLIYEL